MKVDRSHVRHYQTLCRVLDAIRDEAPPNDKFYRPSPGNAVAVTQARSRALIHLFLKARFGLVRFDEREALITDGAHDGGIDAYFIDRKNKRIYVLQSKFRDSANNFVSSAMTPTDLLKMEVGRILKGEKRSESGKLYNERITRGIQLDMRKLPDSGSYTTVVVLLGNATTFTPLQLKKLVEGYEIDQFSHERAFNELLFPVVNGTYFNDPHLTIEISLANSKGGKTHLDYDVRVKSLESNVKLVFVPTREIARIMHTYKNSILKFNPRSFLELTKNHVNNEIMSSIRNTDGNEFALFNNGITMISDNTQFSSDTAKRDTAQLVLRNPQLVNGAQTAYTLSRLYEEGLGRRGDVFKGKEVLLKIITFVGPTRRKEEAARVDLIGEISKASNSQSKVEESDRRSNDRIQLQLQQALFDRYGLYYERKRGEFSDGIHHGYLTPDLVVNRERLVRVALACDFKVNLARSSVSKFFQEAALTDLLSLQNVDRYAYGYETLELLRKYPRTLPKRSGDRYHERAYGHALRYGLYAVVSICTNLGLPKDMSAQDSIRAVLAQWKAYEKWVSHLRSNSLYRPSAASFDYVNYYKGSTINADLKKYEFKL